MAKLVSQFYAKADSGKKHLSISTESCTTGDLALHPGVI